MAEVIREVGIIPLFKSDVPGYSIEEMTDPDCWFTSSDQLGPWDWKVDAVNEGDIAYGKFLGGKAAFATIEYFAHLMNYRRNIKKYRAALGEKNPAKTRSEILMKHLSPAALECIRENGSAESKEIREAISKAVTPALIKKLGNSYKANLIPSVRKSISDTVIQFLEMGTWIVTGSIRRVYRGADCHYSGWQRSTLTTPDELFSSQLDPTDCPSWVRHIEDVSKDSLTVDCSPEESRQFLIEHISKMYPGHEKEIAKLL